MLDISLGPSPSRILFQKRIAYSSPALVPGAGRGRHILTITVVHVYLSNETKRLNSARDIPPSNSSNHRHYFPLLKDQELWETGVG